MIQEIYFPSIFISLTVGFWILSRQDNLYKIFLVLGERTPEQIRDRYKSRIDKLGLNIDPALLVGLKYGIALSFIIFGLVFVIGGQYKLTFVCFILAILGWGIPSYWLYKEQKRKRNEIERDFPSMVKLLKTFSSVVGLENALPNLADVTEGELQRQLELFNYDLATKSTSEALALFAKRCDYDKIYTISDVVRFGIETGTDVSDLLTTLAKRAQNERVDQERRKIKSRPILMSVIPALMVFVLILLFGIPMLNEIITQLQNIG